MSLNLPWRVEKVPDPDGAEFPPHVVIKDSAGRTLNIAEHCGEGGVACDAYPDFDEEAAFAAVAAVNLQPAVDRLVEAASAAIPHIEDWRAENELQAALDTYWKAKYPEPTKHTSSP